MKKILLAAALIAACARLGAQDLFPDGTPIPAWFSQSKPVDIAQLGKAYRITDHGVKSNDSTLIQTEAIQAVIDRAAQAGGGVIVVPKGTYLTGSLFFKPRTHLHLEANAVLKGSDDISDFKLTTTRIEGQTVRYFAALINADSVDGFTLSGKGTVNGNGLRYWRAFWLRRQFNPWCTNKDEMRPRLVYISRCKNVQLEGVSLINSPFWTTHLYKCDNVKLLNLHIFAPAAPVKAPSSDAVDIDACNNVLIKGCYMSVNDDAVALKGGKGLTAHTAPDNGPNTNILIEDCTYGFCHSALTCGSECVATRNILLRRCDIRNAQRLLHLKMRPDTHQNYDYVTVADITGDARSLLFIKPWSQFADPNGEVAPSACNHIVLRNLKMDCNVMFDVAQSPQYTLSNFTLENLNITAKKVDFRPACFTGLVLNNVVVNGKELKAEN